MADMRIVQSVSRPGRKEADLYKFAALNVAKRNLRFSGGLPAAVFPFP